MFKLMSVPMSFINSKHRMGLRTEPWGTPEVAGMLSDEKPLMTTCWEWSLRKSSSRRFLRRIPYLLSFVRSLSCDNLSKALLKSITMQSTCLWTKSILWRSCSKSMSWVSHGRPSPKLCCSGMRIPLSFKCLLIWLTMTCSNILEQTQARETGR